MLALFMEEAQGNTTPAMSSVREWPLSAGSQTAATGRILAKG